MLNTLVYRLIGLGLVVFCGMTWAWMLGAFADITVGIDQTTAKWMNPGILSMPGTISVIAGLIGIMYLTGVFPLFDQKDNDGNMPVGKAQD